MLNFLPAFLILFAQAHASLQPADVPAQRTGGRPACSRGIATAAALSISQTTHVWEEGERSGFSEPDGALPSAEQWPKPSTTPADGYVGCIRARDGPAIS